MPCPNCPDANPPPGSEVCLNCGSWTVPSEDYYCRNCHTYTVHNSPDWGSFGFGALVGLIGGAVIFTEVGRRAAVVSGQVAYKYGRTAAERGVRYLESRR